MITTVVSETGRHRLVLTHYAPEEECRAHRHMESQISLLLVGAYEETSSEGRRTVAGASLSCKPEGFEHENRFGEHGALMLSLHGQEPADPATSYFVTQLENRRAGTTLLEGAAGAGPWEHNLYGGRALGSESPPAINPGLQKARQRLLGEPDLSTRGAGPLPGFAPCPCRAALSKRLWAIAGPDAPRSAGGARHRPHHPLLRRTGRYRRFGRLLRPSAYDPGGRRGQRLESRRFAPASEDVRRCFLRSRRRRGP